MLPWACWQPPSPLFLSFHRFWKARPVLGMSLRCHIFPTCWWWSSMCCMVYRMAWDLFCKPLLTVTYLLQKDPTKTSGKQLSLIQRLTSGVCKLLLKNAISEHSHILCYEVCPIMFGKGFEEFPSFSGCRNIYMIYSIPYVTQIWLHFNIFQKLDTSCLCWDRLSHLVSRKSTFQ